MVKLQRVRQDAHDHGYGREFIALVTGSARAIGEEIAFAGPTGFTGKESIVPTLVNKFRGMREKCKEVGYRCCLPVGPVGPI